MAGPQKEGISVRRVVKNLSVQVLIGLRVGRQREELLSVVIAA
jgi:hypothetical protein